MRVRDLAISHNSLFFITNLLFIVNWVSKQHSQFECWNIVEIDKIVFLHLIKRKRNQIIGLSEEKQMIY